MSVASDVYGASQAFQGAQRSQIPDDVVSYFQSGAGGDMKSYVVEGDPNYVYWFNDKTNRIESRLWRGDSDPGPFFGDQAQSGGSSQGNVFNDGDDNAGQSDASNVDKDSSDQTSKSAAIGSAQPVQGAPTEKSKSCVGAAMNALQKSADGVAVYNELGNKAFFKTWLDCSDPQFELSTAVHESVHLITSDRDAFPLVNGGEVKRPNEVSAFTPPEKVGYRFPGDDEYAKTYLRPGRASSAQNFLYLMDELNAYTHDLNTAVYLKNYTSADRSSDHRDGLAALMAFVATYLQEAKSRYPSTWNGLQSPKVAKTLAILWAQAEKVMQSSCGIPNFGTQYKRYMSQTYSSEARSAVRAIIGRAPVAPAACLNMADDVE